jgi:hypothetical protein
MKNINDLQISATQLGINSAELLGNSTRLCYYYRASNECDIKTKEAFKLTTTIEQQNAFIKGLKNEKYSRS